MSGRVEVKQGGDPRETTMLFSDIRGFTSMSEGMRAEDIVSMLNEYFEKMVEIVFLHEGTLDKFVGQGYGKWDGELGKKIHSKDASLASLSDEAVAKGLNPKPQSGRQEMLENLINRFV
jgi:class 3 adenylate cyclase